MEKQSGGRKIFGAQLNEDDASRLVGGIVEKGFSDTSTRPGFSLAPPRPTVLPFPAARHRSHGPHWKPKIQGSIYNGEEAENEAEEEEDVTGLNKIGAFANAVPRKDKKGLDFSRWREIVDGGNNSRLHKKEDGSKEQQNFKVQCENVGKLNSGSISQDATMHDKESEVPEVIKEQEQIVSDTTIDVEEGNVGMPSIGLKKLSEDVQVDNGRQSMQTDRITDGFLSQNVGNGPAVNLESQIDAENRARLAGMSADEIAEAQAEILAKLSPAGIEAFKKRGLNKLKRKNHSNSGSLAIGEKDSFQNEKSLADSTVSSASSNSNVASNANLKEKHGDLDGNIPNSFPKGTGLWDGWSKRVERVRELRFSMEGDIIENDTHLAATTAGAISSSSDYTLHNVSERDFIRTEGDPGAAGYTIKEAVALTRSVISGQRALALHLIASVLNKAIFGICQNQFASTLNYTGTNDSIDWEAIWAFALGPEPELALALRICLDDNHNSVVLACAKVIQCVLTCEINESFFDIAERIPYYWMDAPTAPVFRSRPDIDGGFLHGGFWKYNTKPSNILPLAEDSPNNKPEDEHTIQDDIVVAGQDIAAGLVRMGIIQRFCYLLEMDPSAALEECTLSILIAIARHSPTCANAVMKCKSLVQIIVNRFSAIDPMKITTSKIKAVTLLKILARVSKKNCAEFVNNGIFEKMTLHLYLYSSSLDQWLKSGREACKLSSALLVEQLRFWEVCIHYGYSVSHFSNLFPALCIWLTFPAFEKLIEKNVVKEYAMISKEAFLVLRALSKRLPNFYSNVHQMKATTEDTESWSWSSVGPLIDSALEWTIINNIPHICRLLECENEHKEYSVTQESEINSLLWLISSAMHMFSGILEAVIPEDNINLCNGRLPWLPEFVPKIGLKVIKNGFFSFSGVSGNKLDGQAGTGSLLESLCLLRLKCGVETSIASTCCLQGVIQVVVAVNKLISLANCKTHDASSIYQTISREDKILSDGILQSCLPDLGDLITSLAELIDPKWQPMQSIETFGRGGPAPGIGVGWGASGGGFWSKITLSAEVDGILLVYLLDTLQIISSENQFTLKEMSSVIRRINSALAVCLVLGPKGQSTIDKLFGILFQAPVLKSLDFIIRQSIDLKKWLKPFEWEYKEEDYLLFSNALISHSRNRWLGRKQKRISSDGDQAHNKSEKGRISLGTIHEETAVSSLTTQDPTSLVVEWAHQRLPLPLHWFLSPLSTVHCSKNKFPSIASNTMTSNQEHTGFLDVLKGGLFFTFGIEAASTLLAAGSPSPVLNVPVVWKLHALSVVLLTGMNVLEEGNCRIVYENLQNIYGQLLDVGGSTDVKSLNFQTEIHDGYSTFVETLVEQFAAVSYGDFLFGRQVACYLHRSVEAPVRLATWNALSTAFALELLPPLEKCISTADGYLEPVEDDERILEAYVKSWVSGALDKASTRLSASFTLALHHLSTFIFKTCSGDMLPLRNKLVRSLLRDCSRKQHHEGMMISLILYEKADAYMSQQNCETENRLQKLREGCEGNSSVLKVVEKLGSEISLKQHGGS
ncbi:PREDICTED: transcriptional elongation regulator MINIYO isoform X1 [Ipomoea nil]|uniref:transcriptional elongation regulator MINIYO isoform X1 n=1 Tax=Ipomoea nil TaxID=35883 RepID=UPI00090167C6|nr:PREDICTED: transcriptional elongation regulator MINIYO isoform X1 [Ipomoea nil]